VAVVACSRSKTNIVLPRGEAEAEGRSRGKRILGREIVDAWEEGGGEWKEMQVGEGHASAMGRLSQERETFVSKNKGRGEIKTPTKSGGAGRKSIKKERYIMVDCVRSSIIAEKKKEPGINDENIRGFEAEGVKKKWSAYGAKLRDSG